MAGAPKPEFPPILRPGFHACDIAGLRRLCVAAFPASITRFRIMERLDALINLINQNRMVGEIWIDGSFLTSKINPDDVDLILVLSPATHGTMDAQQLAFFDWFCTNNLYQSHRCDNYGIILDRSAAEGEWMYVYWLRQFGFSRGDQMKGVAVTTVPFLVTP
jgi:hypothetical protein